MLQSHTIAALATARGRAALAIIRVSGETAIQIVNAVFRGKNLAKVAGNTVHFGYIQDEQGNDIDQVVVTVFRAPRSATGEDVVEITCHGGDFAPQLILQTLIHQGARLAEAGEFTQRAFLNGKIDLTQAEAVADLIHASSSMAHRVSLNHLQGRYSAQIMRVRAELLELAAMIELELDFAEEDVEFADKARLERLLEEAKVLLSGLTDSYRMGALVRDGVRVVIGGRPNAGKSSLLNALIGRDRAIVSPIAGTTRDEIEVDVEMGGVLFRFVDTAGLRETEDFIEAEGVKRAEKSIEAAEILLYVYDASLGLDAEEHEFIARTLKSNSALKILLVANKVDLFARYFNTDHKHIGHVLVPQMALSALAADVVQMEDLQRHIVDLVAQNLSEADASTMVMNQRHRQHLYKALEVVQSAAAMLRSGHVSGDRLALDLRIALHELGAITGEITTEDILGEIFSRFCIGK